MKKQLILLCGFALACGAAWAQGGRPGAHAGGMPGGEQPQGTVQEAQREYSIVVYERDPNRPFAINRELAVSRGFVENMFGNYRATLAGKVNNVTVGILDAGVNMLVKAFTRGRENRQKWQRASEQEMTFTKTLPMQTEISDFYKSTSKLGAMDPEDIMFRGFGCRQYLSYGNNKRILVYEIACSLDTTTMGKQRIVHHSKFQIKVDSIKFNPALCDLPNDSIKQHPFDPELRVPFSFDTRKDLKCVLTAGIYSSWMNEAIEVFNEQLLGKFQIEFSIPNADALNKTGEWAGYFTYNSKLAADSAKRVTVTGESFIVPRSYVGFYADELGERDNSPLWGTGQYRIDMQITETCRMDESHYKQVVMSGGKRKEQWNDNWKAEWKKFKQRDKYRSQSFLDNVVAEIKQEFDVNDHKWVFTLTEPIKEAIIIDEQRWVNRIITGDESGGQAGAAAAGMMPTADASAAGGMQQGGDMPAGGGQAGGGAQPPAGKPQQQ